MYIVDFLTFIFKKSHQSPGVLSAEEQPVSELVQLFKAIDTDGNNLIDMGEGLRYLLQIGTYADLGKMVQGIQELTNDERFITPGMFDAALEGVKF